MTSAPTPSTPSTPFDLVDRLVPLAPGQSTWKIRHERPKVVEATQGSYEALFSPAVEGLAVIERLLVALHACRIGRAAAFGDHYRERLLAEGAEASLVDAVDRGGIASLREPRLARLLSFTATLMRRPLDGDQAAVQALREAGLSTPAIVALAQLVAFLSYQVRLAAGLKAMSDAEAAA